MATESQVKKKIIDYLEKKGWYIIRLKVTGRGGESDLLALKYDRPAFFIEAKKTKGGITSALQKYNIKKLKKLRFHAIVANSLDIVKIYEKEENW